MFYIGSGGQMIHFWMLSQWSLDYRDYPTYLPSLEVDTQDCTRFRQLAGVVFRCHSLPVYPQQGT